MGSSPMGRLLPGTEDLLLYLVAFPDGVLPHLVFLQPPEVDAQLPRLRVLLVEEVAECRGPRLIRNLPVDRIDDRPADHRSLAADRDVLGALRLGILDAVGDDVARLVPLPLEVRLEVGGARRLPVWILLRRVPRIDPAGRRRILRWRRPLLRAD